jgi:hypothetical protein
LLLTDVPNVAQRSCGDFDEYNHGTRGITMDNSRKLEVGISALKLKIYRRWHWQIPHVSDVSPFIAPFRAGISWGFHGISLPHLTFDDTGGDITTSNSYTMLHQDMVNVSWLGDLFHITKTSICWR